MILTQLTSNTTRIDDGSGGSGNISSNSKSRMIMFLVAVPADPTLTATIVTKLKSLQSKSQSQQAFLFLWIHPSHTRALWNDLVPCLLQGPRRTARIMLQTLLDLLSRQQQQEQQQQQSFHETLEQKQELGPKNNVNIHQVSAAATTSAAAASAATTDSLLLVPKERQRQLRKIPLQSQHLPTSCKKSWWLRNKNRKAFINTVVSFYLLPDPETRLEYAWEQRLIHWEHLLILAQSLAGFYSTLGGGFFMTRHVRTALACAVEQQKMALVLGDYEMYFKCQINQAYDWIRCGQFGPARRLIHSVQRAIGVVGKDTNNNSVLVKMCRSALIFAKRVKQAATLLPPASNNIDNDHRKNNNKSNNNDDHVGNCSGHRNLQGGHQHYYYRYPASAMVDDYYRIRIVEDQSSQRDIERSFQLMK